MPPDPRAYLWDAAAAADAVTAFVAGKTLDDYAGDNRTFAAFRGSC